MAHTNVRPFRTMSNLELSQNRAQSVVDYLISKDIPSDRLKARGYGPEVPRVIDEKLAAEYDFLNVSDSLTKEFIEALPDNDKQEIAHQLNRRTEFRVLSTDYVEKELRDQNMNVDDQILKMGMDELQQGRKAFDRSAGGDKELNEARKKAAEERIKKATEKKGGDKLP